MLENLITNQVKSLIKKAIERFAKEKNVNPDRVALWIYPKTTAGEPGLKLMVDLKPVDNLEFADLATKMQKITYLSMGFDIGVQTPIWIHKFMVRVSIEKDIPISKPCYYLRILNNDIVALMFLDNKKAIFFNEADDTVDQLAKYKISLEYILNTR